MSCIISGSSTHPSLRPARESGIVALNRIKRQSDQDQRRDQRERRKDLKFKQNIVKYKHTLDQGEGRNEEEDEDGDAHMIASPDAQMEDEYSSSPSESENSEVEEEGEDDHENDEEESKEDNTINHKKRHRATNRDDIPANKEKKVKFPFSFQFKSRDSGNRTHRRNEDDLLDEDEEWGKNTTRRKYSCSHKQAVLHRSQIMQANRRIIPSTPCFNRIDAATTAEERVEAIINEIFLPESQQPKERAIYRLTVPNLESKINLQSPRTGLTLLMCLIEVTRTTRKYNMWYWKAVLDACKNVNLLLTNHQGENLLHFLLAPHKAHHRSHPQALNGFEHKLLNSMLKREVDLLFQKGPSGGYPIESLIRTWAHDTRTHKEMLKVFLSDRFRHLTSMKIDEYGNTWLHLYLQLYTSQKSSHWNNELLRRLNSTDGLARLESIDLTLVNAAGESIYQLLNNFFESAHNKFIMAKKQQQASDDRAQAMHGHLYSYWNANRMVLPSTVEFHAKIRSKVTATNQRIAQSTHDQ